MIKNYLDNLEKNYKNIKTIYTDPIKYVYQFQDSYNKELVGLMIALFSYGNIKAMFQFMDQFIDYLKPDPINKIMDFKDNYNINLYYRFQSKNDIKNIFMVFKELIINDPSQKYLFKIYYNFNNNFTNIYPLLDNFIENIKTFIPKKIRTDGITHYFCLRNKNSVLKRYCLFFRWMVRKNYPDFGLYNFLEPKMLIFPLDTHILHFAYTNHIISSKISSRKNAIKITDYFKQFCPEDPLKYDFYIIRDYTIKNPFRY
jgi:uncharacterized protein (TIGR02757 family)